MIIIQLRGVKNASSMWQKDFFSEEGMGFFVVDINTVYTSTASSLE